jgi:hypothetical protein
MTLNNIQKRFLLFFLCCIGLRTLFVIIAKTSSPERVQLLGYLALLPALGFTYIYLSNARPTGLLGDKVWWNHLRPVHAILYALFAYSAINKLDNAWVYLLLDVLLGLTSFLYFHYTENNFKYLLN